MPFYKKKIEVTTGKNLNNTVSVLKQVLDTAGKSFPFPDLKPSCIYVIVNGR